MFGTGIVEEKKEGKSYIVDGRVRKPRVYDASFSSEFISSCASQGSVPEYHHLSKIAFSSKSSFISFDTCSKNFSSNYHYDIAKSFFIILFRANSTLGIQSKIMAPLTRGQGEVLK
jgi:hypothetical protein